MFVLSRKEGEGVDIGDCVAIDLISFDGRWMSVLLRFPPAFTLTGGHVHPGGTPERGINVSVRIGQSLFLKMGEAGEIEVKFKEVNGDRAKIGLNAPREMKFKYGKEE